MKRTGGFQKGNNSNSGPAPSQPSKKPRFNEDDEYAGAFGEEEDFAMLDESQYEKIEGVEDDHEQVGRWIRPREVAYDTSKPLLVHWIDLDMLSGPPLESDPAGGDMIGSREGHVPIIRMYGVTQEGYSAMVCVHGFTPYLYASLHGMSDIPKSALGHIRSVLDQKVRVRLFPFHPHA